MWMNGHVNPPAPPSVYPCKRCGVPVPAGIPACPQCGIHWPNVATGWLVINRTSKFTGFLNSVKVSVNGQPAGTVANGGSITLELPAGQHFVEVRGGLLSNSATVFIGPGQTTAFQMFFSEWGILGGG